MGVLGAKRCWSEIGYDQDTLYPCMKFSKNKRVNIKEDANSLHADF